MNTELFVFALALLPVAAFTFTACRLRVNRNAKGGNWLTDKAHAHIENKSRPCRMTAASNPENG